MDTARGLARTATTLLLALLVSGLVTADRAHAAQRPDILLIVTDDQPLGTMRFLPGVKAALPVRYANAFVSNPMCCPSRSTILTGLYSHDSGVWANAFPYGGWRAYRDWENTGGLSLPAALHASGYRTALYGKFLNGWDGSWVPVGWDHFVANSTDGRNGPDAPYYDYLLEGREDAVGVEELHGHDDADYSTYVLADHVREFIATSPADMPLFAYYAPNAPHSAGAEQAPIPAPEDVGADVDITHIEGPAFNEADVSDKVAWVRRLDKVSPDEVDRWKTKAARTLLGVDRAIGRILDTQRQRDPDLSNTIVFFMSDNGFSYGAHRYMAKGVPYEQAIRVPMLAWYPPELGGSSSEEMVINLDIAPTFAEAAGIEFSTKGDGQSLLHGAQPRRHFIIEGAVGNPNRVFCGVRTTHSKFVKYGTGEREFYNLTKDPYELRNHPDAPQVAELHDIAARGCDPLPPDWPRAKL